MDIKYRTLNGKHTQDPGDEGDRRQFEADVLTGLSRSPKSLPSKYFYDDYGSEIFRQITRLPEYYLTRCEYEIIRDNRAKIAELIGRRPFNLVELGAGDGSKTRLLLEYFQEAGMEFRYVPIDISEMAMQQLIELFAADEPRFPIEGLVAEYFEGLNHLGARDRMPKVVLFLGSSIGNMTRDEAVGVFQRLWHALDDGDYLLTGFDLKKDIPRLERAYNDSRGLTARFNLNLLDRINRELEGNFKPDYFRFNSNYNVRTGAVESHLVSLHRHEVRIGALRRSFEFEPWEGIHTEYSYKYLHSDIRRMAEETGFRVVSRFGDAGDNFVDSLWRVVKKSPSTE